MGFSISFPIPPEVQMGMGGNNASINIAVSQSYLGRDLYHNCSVRHLLPTHLYLFSTRLALQLSLLVPE